MSEENVTKPEGKGMAISGFVISLVVLIFAGVIALIATASVATGGSAWLMYFWTLLSAVSVILSVMGMSKLGKTGGKKGLAIAGMIIGIVGLIWCIMLVMGINAAASAGLNEMGDAFKELDKSLEQLENLPH